MRPFEFNNLTNLNLAKAFLVAKDNRPNTSKIKSINPSFGKALVYSAN